MATPVEYGLMADAAYLDIRGRANVPVETAGWTHLDRTQFGLLATPSPSGFSAEIFRKGSEIVIAFQGTNPDPVSSDGVSDWFITNRKLFFGWADQQLREAALLYQRVKATRFVDEPNPLSITFTGHSLGGGLAGLMAVYFNHPATIFAPAPFETAANISVARTLKTVLAQQNFNDSELNAIADAPNLDVFVDLFLQRESAVVGHAINGEALALFRAVGNTIAMWPLQPIDIGSSELSAKDRHSMQLHAAALESVALRNASIALPQLLKFVADTKLFARPLSSNTQKDLLQRLLEFQFGAPSAPSVMANGLNRFAEDANRLGARSISALDRARLDGLIQILLQRYHEASDNPFTGQFIELFSGGVRFDISQVSGGNLKLIKGYQKKRKRGQVLKYQFLN
jgi:hypothetical protein